MPDMTGRIRPSSLDACPCIGFGVNGTPIDELHYISLFRRGDSTALLLYAATSVCKITPFTIT